MPEKKNQYIDIHCHILPEVDDGARNLEESLAMLRQEVKQGMEAVILTPHQKPNRPSITAASVLERTQKLQQAATENGIDIRLYSGGEIFCCMDTIELLKQGKAGTLAGSDYILTEFSPEEEWAYIRNCLYELLCEGYRPIVAHVTGLDILRRKGETQTVVVHCRLVHPSHIRQIHKSGIITQCHSVTV